MGAAGDGWGLRGRSRSAPGSLRSGCVRGAGKGSARCGARKKPGEDGGGPYGAAAVGVPTSAPVVASQPTPLGAAPLRCPCAVLAAPRAPLSGGGCGRPSPRMGGGVTTHPAPPLPPPLGLCLCPDLTPPPTPGLHAPHPRCAARFCCTLGAACCDPPPPQPAVSRGGDARGHVRGAAECHRPPPHPPPSPQWGSDGQRGVCA